MERFDYRNGHKGTTRVPSSGGTVDQRVRVCHPSPRLAAKTDDTSFGQTKGVIAGAGVPDLAVQMVIGTHNSFLSVTLLTPSLKRQLNLGPGRAILCVCERLSMCEHVHVGPCVLRVHTDCIVELLNTHVFLGVKLYNCTV